MLRARIFRASKRGEGYVWCIFGQVFVCAAAGMLEVPIRLQY